MPIRRRLEWSTHSKLLNVKFDWPRDLRPEISPTEGDPPPFTTEHITADIGKMKCGKAVGPSGVMAEMLKDVGPEGTELIRQLAVRVLAEEPILRSGKRVSSSTFIRARVMTWTRATTGASSSPIRN